jgi:hypothetical protein
MPFDHDRKGWYESAYVCISSVPPRSRITSNLSQLSMHSVYGWYLGSIADTDAVWAYSYHGSMLRMYFNKPWKQIPSCLVENSEEVCEACYERTWDIVKSPCSFDQQSHKEQTGNDEPYVRGSK